ncbi:MAG: DUF4274 domain-containing protein [Ruminococcus flavefaciens]|nr:DUF4274 domain-containing protein [Ruminococcus flavefaciens]MCM1229356.1 DUF4274 domain-containing protein [Ruminococcus flavefaciens]
MTYSRMKKLLDEYNWDDGLELPKQIVSDSNCDLAMALEVFWLGDGSSYIFDDNSDCFDKEWYEFIKKLYNDINNGKYAVTENHFEISLTRTEKYYLQKKGVPEIFYKDL